MTRQFTSGYTVGNGAAINVELGWIPDHVSVWNLTDGDLVTHGFLSTYLIPFSSGGTTEIVDGDTITGATSGATAIVKDVLLYSGTWAGGDAAGFFVVDYNDLTGTFGSENVYVGSGTNDATVTVNVTPNISIGTAAASATGNSALSPYAGSAGSAARGFTIGSTVAEEAKALYWEAERHG